MWEISAVLWYYGGVSQIKTDAKDVKPDSIIAATEIQHHLADGADLMSEASQYLHPTLKQPVAKRISYRALLSLWSFESYQLYLPIPSTNRGVGGN